MKKASISLGAHAVEQEMSLELAVSNVALAQGLTNPIADIKTIPIQMTPFTAIAV